MYYYHKDDRPLIRCPRCNHNLTTKGGITIELVLSSQGVRVASCLDHRGRLVDTEDSAVAKGFHSATRCSRCSEQLINMYGVLEDWEDDPGAATTKTLAVSLETGFTLTVAHDAGDSAIQKAAKERLLELLQDKAFNPAFMWAAPTRM